MTFVLSVLLFYSLNFIFYIFFKVVSKFFAFHYPHSLLFLLSFFPLLLLITKMLLLLNYHILVNFVCLTLYEELIFAVLQVDDNFFTRRIM